MSISIKFQYVQVGGTGKAWAVPSNTNFYVNWAANISFQKGDELRKSFRKTLIPPLSTPGCVNSQNEDF